MPKLSLVPAEPTPWTRIPNQAIDRLMPTLRDTELRVYLVLLRSTVGWNRDGRAVILSYASLQRRTGRSSEAVSRALKELERKGVVHISRSRRDENRWKPKDRPSETEDHH